jgi:hypothetical protein
MTDAEVYGEWQAIRDRWDGLFRLLDTVDLRLSPRSCAEQLNLGSKGALERELQQRGLPRFRVLRDWWYVVTLHENAKQSSLADVALARGDYPSILYRFVRATTGLRWREIAAMNGAQLRKSALRVWAGLREPSPRFD